MSYYRRLMNIVFVCYYIDITRHYIINQRFEVCYIFPHIEKYLIQYLAFGIETLGIHEVASPSNHREHIFGIGKIFL